MREFTPKEAEKQHISFDEWKAIKSGEIEELADYFMAHDSEGYFTGDKYNEAYRKIEELCRMAYERR